MAEHLITRDAPTHRRWEVDQEPVVRIQPGDVVTAETDDFAGGQITRDSTAADLPKLDFELIYPLAGPIHVEGAEPGDAVAIEFLEFELPEWGWACIIPGFGLLPPGEFTEPYIKFFDLTAGDEMDFAPGVRLPIEPFCGTTGVPSAGMHGVPIPPPHAGGGNIDCRHLTKGTTLYLPVGVSGALVSLGDAHAAQGDGEVAISGVEPDLMEASRAAVRAMIDHLVSERGLSREDAYMLCSLAGDLKVTEVVDAPNWMVGCFMPDAVFT